MRRWFFFFNDTATTEIYTLSLHDALPISSLIAYRQPAIPTKPRQRTLYHPPVASQPLARVDPASGEIGRAQRLNSSHANISYAVFCLKKKNKRAHTCRPPASTSPSSRHPP